MDSFYWANPGLLLFIFVLFKLKSYRKNCRLYGIVLIEGEHGDSLTTTTDPVQWTNFINDVYLYGFIVYCFGATDQYD